MYQLFEAVDNLCKKLYYRYSSGIDRTDIEELNYTVVDLEMTGFKLPPEDFIIEIGAVRIEKMQVVGEFSTFVRALKPVPPIATQITGITDDDLKYAPRIGAVLRDFFKFSENSVLVAYNVSMDYGFLNEAAILSMGFGLKRRTLCAFELSQKIFYFLERPDFDYVLEYLNIPVRDRHRALGDARMTAEFLVILLGLLRKLGISTYAEAKSFEQTTAVSGRMRELLEHYRRLGVI